MNILTLFKQVDDKDWPVYAGHVLIDASVSIEFLTIDEFGYINFKTNISPISQITHMEYVNRVFGIPPEALGAESVKTVFARVPGPRTQGAKLEVVQTEQPYSNDKGSETAFNDEGDK